MFRRILIAGTGIIVIGSALPAVGQSDEKEGKGLIRQTPDSVAAVRGSEASASPRKLKLQGTVLKEYPCPNNVFDFEPPVGDSSSSASKLDAIISKTHSRDLKFKRLMRKGDLALLQGYLQKAEKSYYEAVRELKKTNQKDLRLARARNALANVLLRNAQTIDARNTFELARKVARDNHGGSIEEAKAIAGLAAVAKQKEDYKKAEKLLKEALDKRRTITGDIDAGVAQMLLNLAELYRTQQVYEEAEPVYKLALETLNKSENVPDLTKAYFLDKTGVFFHDQAKMPEARRCFAMALDLKDKYTTLYSPVDGRKRGLVYYRCLNGVPNAARVFSRKSEIEYLKIKDSVAVATLTAQIFSHDWYLLKAEVTIQNQGKKSISACGEPPKLTLEQPKRQVLNPLDSHAIARELGRRGRLLYSRLLHSADHLYTVQSFGVGATTTAGLTPFGAGVFNTIGGWTSITPDWGARIAARNSAISALASARSSGRSVLATKPTPMTIGPGETATFQVFYPYKKFLNSTLRFLVGNAVLEFPFTSQSG